MSLAAAATLLQTALLLLSTANASPNLSADFRQHAIDVANQAISEAHIALTDISTTGSQNSQSAAVAVPLATSDTLPEITNSNIDASLSQQTITWSTNIPTISVLTVSDSQGNTIYVPPQPVQNEINHSAQLQLKPGIYNYAIYPSVNADASRKIGSFTVAAPVTVPSTSIYSGLYTGINSNSLITVVYAPSGCDYFISSQGAWDQLLEWFSGNIPVEGATYYGDLSGYGFKDIYGPSGSMHIWEEDYLLSDTEAASKYADKCVGTAALSNNNYYTNVNGITVHSPAYSTGNLVPANATAQCVDGTYSFSLSRSGTCSYHGGVSTWLQ